MQCSGIKKVQFNSKKLIYLYKATGCKNSIDKEQMLL